LQRRENRFSCGMSETLTPQAAALDLLTRYYAAFNAGDHPGMLALLTEDVAHDTNQGSRETGRALFAAFLQRMERCYAEQLVDLVLFADVTGTRAAAEFTVLGTYLSTDEGLPAATGQSYRLPAGAFFTLDNGLISRVTLYYNLQEWLAAIAA
jgi:steroid delta-isomerase-like uncharacterized protein